MATWDKDTVFIELVVVTTCDEDETSHTVKFQPLDGSSYPTGAVTGTQGTTRLDRWYPSSDLNDDYHYDVYVNDVFKKRIFSPKSYPQFGE